MNDLKKILNAEQIRNVDNHTISNKPIPSIDLMEYASNCFVNSIWDKQFITKKIAVVCGTGNNGGDGLAISRLLKEKKDGSWYVHHQYKQEKSIWGFGFDEKTKEIFIAPNNLELELLLD